MIVFDWLAQKGIFNFENALPYGVSLIDLHVLGRTFFKRRIRELKLKAMLKKVPVWWQIKWKFLYVAHAVCESDRHADTPEQKTQLYFEQQDTYRRTQIPRSTTHAACSSCRSIIDMILLSKKTNFPKLTTA